LGCCTDQTNGNDKLTMEEMREGLAQGGGVDLILFTAPCNMGSLEAAYEVREQTEIYIGSENSSGYNWWRETMADISTAMHADPQISNHELALVIIDALETRSSRWQEEDWGGGLTMSAVRTDKLEAVKDRVDALSEAYLAQGNHFVEMVEAVRPRLTSFGPFLVDVHSLAQQLQAEETDPGLQAVLAALLQAMDEAILAEHSGPDWPDAQGLTIFLPDEVYGYRLSDYTSATYGLDFVENTTWDELLAAYLGQLGGALEGVSPPPPMISDGLTPPVCGFCY